MKWVWRRWCPFGLVIAFSSCFFSTVETPACQCIVFFEWGIWGFLSPYWICSFLCVLLVLHFIVCSYCLNTEVLFLPSEQVNAGLECGLGLEDFDDWEEGDILEAFNTVQKRRTLEEASASMAAAVEGVGVWIVEWPMMCL